MKLPDTFRGYRPPTSNTTYTPNQFFDVVLPNSSRGVVRLVAYMIRKSLGWSDENGNPQEPQVVVSYRELIEKAGIGRARISEAIDEAIKARFIVCLREGKSKSLGTSSVSALYELCWDEHDLYVTNPKEFQGFYAGNGNLTYIPNDFFDYTVPNEPLAVVRVVGAIIRHTIGWQTKFGMRRQQVAMSYSELQRRTNLTRRSVSQGLQLALEHNHVVRIEEGIFDINAGVSSKPATYGIRWVDAIVANLATRPTESIGSKSIPGNSEENIGSKSIPENPNRFQKYTGIGSENTPEDRFQKYGRIKITSPNNPVKQQQQEIPDETTPFAAVSLLASIGFSRKVAEQLAATYSKDQIDRQIAWIDLRSPAKNRLGMLRRAIEEDWPKPNADQEIQKAIQDAKTAERETRICRKKEHEDAFNERYLCYLRDVEQDIRANHPQLYAVFQDETAEQRRQRDQDKMPPRMRELILSTFDKETEHFDRLKKFCKSHAIDVMDFWQWDTECNPDSLDASSLLLSRV